MKSASKIATSSPLRDFEPGVERAGLVAGAVGAVEVDDVVALVAEALDVRAHERLRLVGRVVEHLNLEAIARVVHARDRIEQARRDGGLVEERELDRDDAAARRPRRARRTRLLLLERAPVAPGRGRPGASGGARSS